MQIDRTSIVKQVSDGIIELIRERNFQENDKLPTEKELCEIFNVGRSTIREANQVLQTLGILVSVPGKGMHVAATSEGAISEAAKKWFGLKGIKLSDYVEIRLAIEPLCTRLAIQRATNEEIAELSKIHTLSLEAVLAGDAFSLATYDEKFHLAIAKATHNKLMVNIQEAIKNEIFEMRMRSFSIPERAPGVVEPHRKILQAFYERDKLTGEIEMRRHIKEAYSQLLEEA
jgi:GntR family transcriptional repressor for pyruvate dehydrogenase complex